MREISNVVDGELRRTAAAAKVIPAETAVFVPVATSVPSTAAVILAPDNESDARQCETRRSGNRPRATHPGGKVEVIDNLWLWCSRRGLLGWTQVSYGGLVSALLAGVAALALAAGVKANQSSSASNERIAFAGMAEAIAAATVSLFAAVYPHVLPSTINAAHGLTVSNASATARTLAVMTVVAVIFLPFVLVYQGWTNWVFRKRIGARDIPIPVALAGPPPEGPAGSAGQVKTAR
jgi:cytochrome bd-type quinol oxidase subunit 2